MLYRLLRRRQLARPSFWAETLCDEQRSTRRYRKEILPRPTTEEDVTALSESAGESSNRANVIMRRNEFLALTYFRQL